MDIPRGAAPTTAPSEGCANLKPDEWCTSKKENGRCEKEQVKQQCQKTCGECDVGSDRIAGESSQQAQQFLASQPKPGDDQDDASKSSRAGFKEVHEVNFECDHSVNFIQGLPYRQISLTDGCPACSANPRYCATAGCNDPDLAIEYCKAQCGTDCTGFFFQTHMNGHEICGFYSKDIKGRRERGGHQYGAICERNGMAHVEGAQRASSAPTPSSAPTGGRWLFALPLLAPLSVFFLRRLKTSVDACIGSKFVPENDELTAS